MLELYLMEPGDEMNVEYIEEGGSKIVYLIRKTAYDWNLAVQEYKGGTCTFTKNLGTHSAEYLISLLRVDTEAAQKIKTV